MAPFDSVASVPELAKSLVVSSFGAMFNINGWGIGYIAGPEKLMADIGKLNNIRGSVLIHPPSMLLLSF